MPVTWWWDLKIGSMTLRGRENQKYKVNIYRGNCLGALIYEYKQIDENNKKVDMYQFFGYWNDENHLKRNLGLSKNFDGNKDNIYADLVKLDLNTYYESSWKIAQLFVKALGNKTKINLYYKPEKIKQRKEKKE